MSLTTTWKHLCVCLSVCARETIKWLWDYHKYWVHKYVYIQTCVTVILSAPLCVHQGRWGSTQPFVCLGGCVCVLALATGAVSGAGGRWAVGLNRDWAGAERWQLHEGAVCGEGVEACVCVWGVGGGESWRKTGIKGKWIICRGQEKCRSAA